MIWSIITSNALALVWTACLGGALGFVIAVVLYRLTSRWLETGLRAARYGVLVLWLATLSMGGAAIGALFAAEESAHDAIASEIGATSRVLGERLGNPALTIAVGALGASAGAGLRGERDLRVPMTALFTAREEIANQLEAILEEIRSKISAKDEGFAQSFRVWVVGQASDALLANAASQRLALIDEFLTTLDAVKAADGTVGTGAFAEVIGDAYLQPHVQSLSSSLFSGMRLNVYLTLFGLILLPMALALLLTRRKQRSPERGIA